MAAGTQGASPAKTPRTIEPVSAHAELTGNIRPAGAERFSDGHAPLELDAGESPATGTSSNQIPAAADWWRDSIVGSLRPGSHPQQVTVEDLLVRALQHSSQVRVFSELPLIRETAVVEADAAFDWTGFMETRWNDTSDPVGNSLTVGGSANRYIDQNWTASGGFRKRTRDGGQLELSQQFGWQDTNSNYFIPHNQGTSRLVLGYTHPLMRGSGRVYNESLKVLACIDASIAKEEFERQLQSHLLEIVRAYWALYLERGVYTQKLQALARAEEVYTLLVHRSEIDAFQSQILSADAEVRTRSSDLARSLAAVKNAEDRIRSLVNDPSLDNEFIELIPLDTPSSDLHAISMDEALMTAVQMRPEINQALKQIKAAAVRVDISKNELMPALNLVTQAYLSGLQGHSDIPASWSNQFDRGRPSYSIGLQYEMPIGNRAAEARYTRRMLELRQLKNQYESTVQTLRLETRVAVREVETSFNELDTKRAAMEGYKGKMDYIRRRWELMPGQGQSGSFVLEDLLLAQSQLTKAENEYLTSMVTYNLALMNLKRATGVLLSSEEVTVDRFYANCMPTQIVSKPNQDAPRYPTKGEPTPIRTPVGSPPAGPMPEPVVPYLAPRQTDVAP
ncbi:MAG: TolC family protein [Planctomycetaceae bacterium]